MPTRDDRGRALPAGKLNARILRRLLKRYVRVGPGVVVGPAIGLDSAVIDFHGRLLVAKTDPITFVADEIGSYALHINANDIAAVGGTPRWFLATVLLHEGTATEEAAERIFADLSKSCKSTGVTLVGGHTEITTAVTSTVVVGQMLGTVDRKRLVTAAGARPGNSVILTKGIAIEGTSIIARLKGAELERAFSARFLARCRNFIKRPGISVVKDAHTALERGRVTAMHDPTEGGLATGLIEICEASKCGIIIEREAINIYPETRKLCSYFGLDPLGLISSGALLITAPDKYTRKIIEGLARSGIAAVRIGTVTAKKGVVVREGKNSKPLEIYEADEITRIIR